VQARRLDQPLALRGLRDIRGDRVGFSARLADPGHRRLERAREGMLAFLKGAGGADHAAALGCEEPGDVGADASARSGDHHDLAVQSAHEILRAAILHDGRARSTGSGSRPTGPWPGPGD
jgi:hypothetical protein